MKIDVSEVKEIINSIALAIEENKQYLTDLDAAIGDGDHGINMAKGFKQVTLKLNEKDFETVDDLLKTTAMTLISNVGGASGPLYGTLFLKASSAVKDKKEIGLSDFCSLLDEGIEGVKARGKSTLGEKTMLDVLIPVNNCLKESLENDVDVNMALTNMNSVAEESVENTKNIVATKGRASYLGERSLGHIDPGAMSSYIMFNTIYKYLKK